MSSTADDLTALLRDGAAYIDRYGWGQGVVHPSSGGLYMPGALRACSTRPGDWAIACSVAIDLVRAVDWNDSADRIERVVMGWMRSTVVTDEDLAGAFGPQWPEQVEFVRRAATLTRAEDRALHAAWVATWDGRDDLRFNGWDKIQWVSLRVPTGGVRVPDVRAMLGTRCVPWRTALEAARDVARLSGATAVQEAAAALTVRDRIGTHGLTQEHYDAFTRAWRTVIGPVHPDDAPLTIEAA